MHKQKHKWIIYMHKEITLNVGYIHKQLNAAETENSMCYESGTKIRYEIY